MPTVKGTFNAVFWVFSAAVEAADVQLKAFESSTSKVESSLSRMVNSMSGTKVVAEAELMAEAVERIGGVSKLTEAELERVGKVAQEAADKMRAMGGDVPQKIQDLADASKRAAGETDNWTTSITNWGSSMLAQVTAANLLSAGIEALVSHAKDLAVGFGEMVLHGSEVGDIEENFRHLTDQAGLLADTLMGTLREGTHNTISDFDLMKTTNQALAAGLNLTEDQFATLSQGAFALAQATGTDVKTGFDTMIDAMVRGRGAALGSLTGKIDLKKAEEEYADALGLTAKELTTEQKLEADRLAMLDAVSAATKRLGEQTDGLDEFVQQAQVSWTNFTNELGKTIAQSPVLEAALVGIRDMLIDAFGGDKEEAIKRIAKAVDDVAIAMVDWAKTGVEAAGFVAKEWLALEKLIGNTVQVLDLARYAWGELNVRLGGWIDQSEKGIAKTKEQENALNSLMGTIKKRGDWLQDLTASQEAVDAGTSKWNDRLDVLKQKLIDARTAADQHKTSTDAAATATESAAGSVKHLGDAANETTGSVGKLSAAQQAYAKVMEDFHLYTIKMEGKAEKEVAEQRSKDLKARNDETVAALNAITREENKLHDLTMRNSQEAATDAMTRAWQVADEKIAAFAASGNRSESELARYSEAVKGQALEVQNQLLVAASAGANAIEGAAHRQIAAVDSVTSAYFRQIDAAARAAGVTVVGKRPGDPGTGINEGGQLPFGGDITTSSLPPGGKFSFQQGGYTDPRVLAEMAIGYTLGEALAIVGGYGGMIGAPHRATGGGVAMGSPYVVGEEGPELFVPSTSGQIVNAQQFKNTFNITDTESGIARRISDHLLRSLMQGRRLSA